jgi:hypothetical protein
MESIETKKVSFELLVKARTFESFESFHSIRKKKKLVDSIPTNQISRTSLVSIKRGETPTIPYSFRDYHGRFFIAFQSPVRNHCQDRI